MSFLEGKKCTESREILYRGTTGPCSGVCLEGLRVSNGVFTNPTERHEWLGGLVSRPIGLRGRGPGD